MRRRKQACTRPTVCLKWALRTMTTTMMTRTIPKREEKWKRTKPRVSGLTWPCQRGINTKVRYHCRQNRRVLKYRHHIRPTWYQHRRQPWTHRSLTVVVRVPTRQDHRHHYLLHPFMSRHYDTKRTWMASKIKHKCHRFIAYSLLYVCMPSCVFF